MIRTLTLEPMDPARERRRTLTRAPLRPMPRSMPWRDIVSTALVCGMLLGLLIIGAHMR